MTSQSDTSSYFPYDIQISAQQWHALELGKLTAQLRQHGIPRIQFFRQLALKLNTRRPTGAAYVHAGELNLYASLLNVFRLIIDRVACSDDSSLLINALQQGGVDPTGEKLLGTLDHFVNLFPPEDILLGGAQHAEWITPRLNSASGIHQLLREMILLRLAASNPAVASFRELLDDRQLAASSWYSQIIPLLDAPLQNMPLLSHQGNSLIAALMAAIMASPDSLTGQVRFVLEQWPALLPPNILHEMETACDIVHEEQRARSWGGDPGPAKVLKFGPPGTGGSLQGHGDGASVFAGFDYPEYEAFSHDAGWMSNVVLMSKMVYIWLDQLSSSCGYPVTRLDQVPDSELDRLAAWGFTGLWLIGLWERSPASQRIKQICGNPEAIASAYSLFDYEIAADLGGWEALDNLRERARKRGIRLASDMVPNHTGLFSRWVIQHPDWFVQTDYPPFPTYQFTGEDLSHDPNICLQIEDGYWNKTDASVVFKHYDKNSGRTRYIYHGNDGTSIPWNDTAQLNYLIPELREAVIQTILHVARNFPIIRFDAAMTLAKKHYQRLWFPLRGLGGGIPSRAEHGMSKEEFDTVFPVEFWRDVVDRVAVEAPGTLLLAEAFWMMEGYFVRTLGMHRVYNSAFMNMLKMEENAKYRLTIRNVLELNHEILKRFVNFMNNPDEKTAVAQFGSQGKYFGACVLLATMPGLPMIGHGQIEGFHEKYGMEYKRAYWDEQIDEGLVRGHEMWIFPLFKRRWLFSGSENFVLYDFIAGNIVNENVFAYSNRSGEQRALVLYHNSHATTAGWIRESVGFAAVQDGDQPQLVRTTLAVALGIDPTPGSFVLFRDLTEGLEYLRSGAELHEKGLYAELGEYQFHVFLDFRELRDDTDGSWLKLHNHLNGLGVASLDEERKQLQYGELNALFRVLFELLAEDRQTGEAAATDVELQQALDLFLIAVTADAALVPARGKRVAAGGTVKRKSARTKSSAIKRYAGFSALAAHTTTADDARSFQLRLKAGFSDQAAEALLLAWLVLRETSLDPVGRGLDYTLRKFLQRDGDPGFGCRAVGLLSALLQWWRSPLRDAAGEYLSQMQGMFELEACQIFLLQHESDGISWFNKERFEELSEWMTVLLLLERCNAAALSARTVSARTSEAECAVIMMANLAQDVGYRSRLFAAVPEKTPIRRIPRIKKQVA
jgi:glycosidase